MKPQFEPLGLDGSALAGPTATAKTFRDIFESAPDALVIVNGQGTIVLANSQTERLFGWTRAELLGKNIELLVPDRFTASHRKHRLGYTATPVARHMGSGLELYGLRKDGSEFPVEISLSPVGAADGKLVSSAIRDISERKRAEREVLAKNTELERAYAELETFSYSISHDLRAPLRAMDGFARVLAKQLGPNLAPDARKSLDRIQENAARMAQLIEGLLRLATLSRHPVEKRRIETEELARRALDELQPDLAGRIVDVQIGNLPPCEGDPALLFQVFVNLLSNAIKFTRGRKTAAVEIGCRQNAGRSVYYVSDNGVGFEMECAPNLFRVFQRLHSADGFEGTGIGLATVQRIVERHGGMVWAEAKVNEGAVFYFTLGRSPAGEATERTMHPARTLAITGASAMSQRFPPSAEIQK